MRLTDHPKATAELTDSARFYEGRTSGLGVRFLAAVARATAMIQEVPERYPCFDRNVRRCHVADFPYPVHYRILSNEIEILAYKHGSRRPDYWHDRLTD